MNRSVNMGSKEGTPANATDDLGRILDNYKKGSTKDFEIFVSHLRDPALSPTLLAAYLKKLTACSNRLGKDFEGLVAVVLNLPWLHRGPDVQEEYKAFVVSLVSAWTINLRACLCLIVKQFMPAPNKEIDKVTREIDETNFGQLHALLKAIIKIVPMTPVVLLPELRDIFPYMTKSAYIHECYVRNLLHITEYLPTLRQPVLELILDRMTKLDVQSPRQDLLARATSKEASEITEAMQGDTLFEMEDIVGDGPGQEEADDNPTLKPTNYDLDPMAHPEGNRLDILMDVVFRYIYSVCKPKGELDWEETKNLYRDLLMGFDRILLTTYASCHVQFVMFYICSFKESLAEAFLDYLWKKFMDPTTQMIFRQIAVYYMGSLVSRAKYINKSMVRAVLDIFTDWIHKYVVQAAYTTSKPDVAHHGTFYSLCQTLFYIFIFRHKEIIQTPTGYKYIQSLNFQTIITSRLNPLRVCQQTVAKTFASVTRQHQLAFCDAIIERNRRNILPVESSGDVVTNPLDSFFPFDPYILNKSSVFIEPLFREYKGTPAQEEEVLEDDMEADFDEALGSTPGGGSVPLSPTVPDFLMYGTSPGFQNT